MIRFRGIIRIALGLSTLAFLGIVQPSAVADGGAAHQVVQARPIELGTSGGNINDRSRIYCCSGTLGSLTEDSAGFQYILSNNHVLARVNRASVGEDINQPGQVDQNCGQTGIIADLSTFVPIAFKQSRSVPLNEVDAAIAAVRVGQVSPDGSIIDIGPVSSQIVSAFVGQAVQKSGRTTGLTTGAVAAINVTVDVGYSKECGGASNQIARFVNQVRVTPGSFSAGGDSGSLVVESGQTSPVDGFPRAVGLLFAGSSSSTIANPIGRVLSLLNVSMAGGTPAKSGLDTITPAVGRAKAALDKHSASLFAKSGVVGHGIGMSESGKPVIEVYVVDDNAKAGAGIPKKLDDVPVNVVVTGPFEAF